MDTSAWPKLANSAPALPPVLLASRLWVMVSGPLLKMAPPLLVLLVWLFWIVAWSSTSVPWLTSAPPSVPPPLNRSRMMCRRVNKLLESTVIKRVLRLPVRVMASPPSMVTGTLMARGTVSTIVLGPQQAKVMVPPADSAAAKSLSVQLPLTTVSCRPVAAGAAATGPASTAPSSTAASATRRSRFITTSVPHKRQPQRRVHPAGLHRADVALTVDGPRRAALVSGDRRAAAARAGRDGVDGGAAGAWQVGQRRAAIVGQ